MIFRVELRIHDTELISALNLVKGKKPYLIEKALIYFLSSQTGKDMLTSILNEKEKNRGNTSDRKHKREGNKGILKEEIIKEKKISIDAFL